MNSKIFSHIPSHIALLLALFVNAVNFHALFSQINKMEFEHLSIENGLSQNSVYVVYQDHQGFIWFGTADGLNRYDGYSITIFKHKQSDSTSLANNTIRSIFEDSWGRLWIGTEGGLDWFDRSTNGFHHFRGGARDTFTIPAGELYSICEDSSGVLFFADGGLFSYDRTLDKTNRYSEEGAREPFGMQITGICKDRKGQLWIISNLGIGIVNRAEKKVVQYHLSGKHLPLLRGLKAIFEDDDGMLWLGTDNQGLFEVDPTTRSVRKISQFPGATTIISSINRDRSGNLCIATYGKGLFVRNRADMNFTQFMHNSRDDGSLSINTLKSICLDNAGILWVGTDGAGVDFFDPHQKQFIHYAHNPLNPNSLSGNFLKSIYEDKNEKLWIGTVHQGLNYFDRKKGTWAHYKHNAQENSISSDNVFSVIEDEHGNIWIGTDMGLDRFNPFDHKFDHFFLPPPSKSNHETSPVYSMAFDTSGNLWIGSAVGVFTMQKGSSRIRVVPELKYFSWKIYSGHDGTLWCGTNGSGLIKINPQTMSLERFSSDPHNPNALSDNVVRCICEDSSGILWLGTEEGLNRFDPMTGQFTSFSERNGLADGFIYGILRDKEGNLWVSTNGGISRFTPGNPTGKQFRNFDVHDGLQSNEFNTGSYCEGKNGEMFFGGVNGMNAFFPDSIRDNDFIPPVVIVAMGKRGTQSMLIDNLIDDKTIDLHYDDYEFTFSFVALNFTHPEKNLYSYKLEGLDTYWIDANHQRIARFTNVEPGRYVFRVKASNNDGVWNETGASVSIYIIPPYWATWWFRLVMFIIVLTVVGTGVRYLTLRRIRRKLGELEHQQALERERTRISKDMHDEVGSSLTKISILSELAKRGDENDRNTNLDKISTSSREVIDTISHIIWAIDPKNDTLENTLAYVREYVAETLELSETRVTFEFPELIDEQEVPSEFRRNIFLAVKEAVNNVVKYSRATSVTMKAAIHGADLDIVIIDNGIGFDIGEVSRFGNGLQNMRKRIEDIGGRYSIHSAPGLGTTVAFVVPITTFV